MGDLVWMGDFAQREVQRICDAIAARRAMSAVLAARRVIAHFHAGGARERSVEAVLAIARAFYAYRAPRFALDAVETALEAFPGHDALTAYAAALRLEVGRRLRGRRVFTIVQRDRGPSPQHAQPPSGEQLRVRVCADIAQGTHVYLEQVREPMCACAEAFLAADDRDGAIEAVIAIADAAARKWSSHAATLVLLNAAPLAIAYAPMIRTYRAHVYQDAIRSSSLRVVP
ncbi:MAG: hypothetical protein Q7T01_05060 [bacterium]|nr:hypothetical protein [bacterium]